MTATLLALFTSGANAQELDPIANLTQAPVIQTLPVLKPKPVIKKHVVKKGETLTKIAQSEKTTVERLWRKNTQLTNPDLLEIGETLVVPSESEKLKERPNTPVTPKVGSQPTQSGSTGLNGYDYPSCTGYVALRRYVPPGLGNATDWLANAQVRGMATGSAPRAGAIAWRYGHVAYVESVSSDGSITVSENNYDYAGSTRTITVSPTSYTAYIY